mmetsp:Transcript_8880/g.12883  ORF Transcript_8880/g.12883 Transcript_8880/m.12883 type:complete len:427 (-) Transcript_8880:1305-2585(-)
MVNLSLLAAIFVWCKLFLSCCSFEPFHFSKSHVSSSTGYWLFGVVLDNNAQRRQKSPCCFSLHATTNDGDDSTRQSSLVQPSAVTTKAPSFNGKVVYPVKAFLAGLKGHEAPVAAVFAILNSEYKRGKSDGWDHSVVYVGITRNLQSSLTQYLENHGPQTVANVRVLSFSFPQLEAMKDIASQWKDLVHQSTGTSYMSETTLPALADELNLLGLANFISNIDDDDDDEEEEEFLEEGSVEYSSENQQQGVSPIISPFSMKETKTLTSKNTPAKLSFTLENVDKVLEEVRPYLLSDGGNVSVQRVDEERGDVYLKLEGACGSCASSTVTMKMGIERVLQENFPTLGQVIQVLDDNPTPMTELSLAVKAEVERLLPAIEAMGGKVSIENVDPVLGVVEVRFSGASRVQTGLELALRDVPMVKHVKFLS